MAAPTDAAAKLAEFERKADPNDPAASELLEQMRAYVSKMEEARVHEDPRLTFTTPEFKAAQRTFAQNLSNNFGKPVEWAMVKQHPWSKPKLVRHTQQQD